VVSFVVESVLGHSPDETFQVEVVGELVTEFYRLEELCSRLERSGVRICDLLLGLPLGQARWAGRLDEATRQLGAKLVARWEVDAELEALRTSVARVQDLVLNNIGKSSSLAASLSVVVELLEGQINTTTATGVRWGTQTTLVAALSHFLELEAEVELLRSGCNVDLTDDQADVLWTWVHATSDSLVSYVPPLVTHSPPDSAWE
jgi:hypothetical protein